MKRLGDILEKITCQAVLILLIGLTISTTLQVLTRYVFKRPLVWTEEASRFFFIWMVFLGASVGVRRKDHFLLDILLVNVPEGLRRVFLILANICVLAVSLILFLVGIVFTRIGLGQLSPTMRIPMAWIYLAMPIAGMLMFVYVIQQVYELIQGLTTYKDKTERLNV